ncbi:MAG: hypothetical protein H6657_00075 [Ardenticatenaceae bacterium]|nr:hypothetical protein [Ardenticatenaceae bacterium]
MGKNHDVQAIGTVSRMFYFPRMDGVFIDKRTLLRLVRKGMNLSRFKILTFFLATVFPFTACGAENPASALNCGIESIKIVPTATRQTDPNLFNPPTQVNFPNDNIYCPTPMPTLTTDEQFPEHYVAAEIVNLSLDIANQNLSSVAIGDDMLAVGWIQDGDVYVALSHGGGRFQTRRVDYGSSVSLAFSAANRLHVVYDRQGVVFYRAADQGTHPADTTFITNAGEGHNPQIAIDSRQWAHIIYEHEGNIYHAAHQYEFYWNIELVGSGERPFLITGSGRLGIPEFGSRDFALAFLSGNDLHVRLYGITPFLLSGWLATAVIPVPESVSGFVRLDGLVLDGQLWLYAAWMSERPYIGPIGPTYEQPVIEPANPLFPEQIANAEYIHTGLNAVRVGTASAPFSAGLWQTITVDDATADIVFEAWGLAVKEAEAEFSIQIGLDVTGGTNPHADTVVWSEAASPSAYAPFALSLPANGSSATIFLRGTQNSSDVPAMVAWDTVSIQNGIGQNLDFEAPFTLENGFTIPEGWHAWYEDSSGGATAARDIYTVYAAWSENGGRDWTGPQVISANQTVGGGTTGALGADVWPLLTARTYPPSASFFTVFAAGDPLPGTQFLRFGRPFLTQCDLGSTTCTQPPGQPLFAPGIVRPTDRLFVAKDPYDESRAALVWDSLQSDLTNKDIYATYVVLR